MKHCKATLQATISTLMQILPCVASCVTRVDSAMSACSAVQKDVAPIPLGPLMLHADPELVHLGEVQEQEVQGVAHVPLLPIRLCLCLWQQAPANLQQQTVFSELLLGTWLGTHQVASDMHVCWACLQGCKQAGLAWRGASYVIGGHLQWWPYLAEVGTQE